MYCKIVRAVGSVVLQYSGMDGLKVYCNTLVCIAGWETRLAESVSQYSLVYCGRKAGCREIVSQYNNCIVTRQGTGQCCIAIQPL